MTDRSKLPPPPALPSQAGDKYIVRFPDGMRDQIAEAAIENNRSMNAEIVARLKASFSEPDAAKLIPVIARLERSLSKMELNYNTAVSRAVFLAEGLFGATANLPPKSILSGHPKNLAAGEWHKLAQETIERAQKIELSEDEIEEIIRHLNERDNRAFLEGDKRIDQ